MRLVVISPQLPASLEIKQHRKSNSWWWHQCFCVWTLIEIKSVSSKSDCDSWAASVAVHNLDKKKPCGPRQVRKEFYLLCNKWVWWTELWILNCSFPYWSSLFYVIFHIRLLFNWQTTSCSNCKMNQMMPEILTCHGAINNPALWKWLLLKNNCWTPLTAWWFLFFVLFWTYLWLCYCLHDWIHCQCSENLVYFQRPLSILIFQP